MTRVRVHRLGLANLWPVIARGGVAMAVRRAGTPPPRPYARGPLLCTASASPVGWPGAHLLCAWGGACAAWALALPLCSPALPVPCGRAGPPGHAAVARGRGAGGVWGRGDGRWPRRCRARGHGLCLACVCTAVCDAAPSISRRRGAPAPTFPPPALPVANVGVALVLRWISMASGCMSRPSWGCGPPVPVTPPPPVATRWQRREHLPVNTFKCYASSEVQLMAAN